MMILFCFYLFFRITFVITRSFVIISFLLVFDRLFMLLMSFLIFKLSSLFWFMMLLNLLLLLFFFFFFALLSFFLIMVRFIITQDKLSLLFFIMLRVRSLLRIRIVFNSSSWAPVR